MTSEFSRVTKLQFSRLDGATCLVALMLVLTSLVDAGCAGTGSNTAPPALARATQAGDRVTGVFEVLAVFEEPLPSGATRVVYHVRNAREHRNLQFRPSLERVVPETGVVASKTTGEVDYAHHGEELDVDFELPADTGSPGSPVLVNRLVINLL